MFCQRKRWKISLTFCYPLVIMVCSALTCEGLIYGKLFMTASLRNAVKETAVKVIISLSLDLEATPRPKPSKPLDSLYLFIYFIGDFCRGSLHKNQSTFDFSSGFSCVMSTCCWSYLQEILRSQGQIINIPGATAVVVLVLAAVSPDPHMTPTAALSRCV